MADSNTAALEIRGLTKRFFGTLALDNVDFRVESGEIHALVGENGAGKSTLIKILAGVYQADAGEILVDGRSADPSLDDLPISFVHQDLGLVDNLSIAENIALITGFPRRLGLIQWREVRRRALETYRSMGAEIENPEIPVGALTAAQKAILGIVRALAKKASFIVLDEPTAALPEPDAEHLFRVLKGLAASGKGIIYVSHRLNELFGLVDRITVLRDGRGVRTVKSADTDGESIVESMLGRKLEQLHSGSVTKIAARPLVEVVDLRVAGRGPFSFDVFPGEILGIVGLQGAGHELVARALFGARPVDSGSIRFGDVALAPTEDIGSRIARGISFLASDRNQESTFPGMTLRENLYPNPGFDGLRPWSYIGQRKEQRRTRSVLAGLDVRPSNPDALIDWLSGGNQQKICIGRWLESGGRLLMFEEPTAGVDVGAKLAIHQMIKDATAKGASAVIVSSDFEEVATLCDRALVVVSGRIHRELTGSDWTPDDVVAAATIGAASS